MKKILSILSFLICFASAFSQTLPGFPSGLQVQGLGAPTNTVWTKNIHSASAGFAWYGTFADTTEANTNSFFKNIAGMTIRTGNTLWIRNTDLTEWLSFGAGTTYVDTTQTVRLSGNGSLADQLVAHVQISQQAGNALDTLPDGIFVQSGIQNGLRSGGLIIWEQNLDYTVTTATYAINNVSYTSPETEITLSAADPTDDRIDLVVVDNTGNVDVVEGTPSSDPQQPSYDPTTQVPLSFILVTAASTEPTYCRDSLYFPNNGQTWTSVSGTARIVVNSTSNPYSPTEDIEFTLARNNDQLRITKATVVSLGTYSVLVLKIRSKAAWAATSRLVLRWYNGLTPLGIDVVIGNGIFGFNSSNAADYQTIVIPLTNFGSVTNPDNLLFTVSTTSNNTIGLYADNIELLGCDGAPIPETGNFWQVGGNRQGVALVGGTLDNYAVQLKTNNANALNITTAGHLFLQKTNPAISFLTGTLAASDYYIRRSGTSLQTNTASSYQSFIAGVEAYRLNVATGNIWYNASGTQFMQLDPSGTLKVGTNSSDTSALFLVNSTTRGSLPAPRVTTAQKNAITSPAEFLMVIDTDLNRYEYYDGANFVPFSVTPTLQQVFDTEVGGSILTKNDTILTNTFKLYVTSTTGPLLQLVNTVSGNSISATTANGTAINATGTSGGIAGTATSGPGVRATGSTLGVAITINGGTTSSVGEALQIFKAIASPVAGVGTKITMGVSTVTGTPSLVIESRYTDVTPAALRSQLDLSLVNNSVETLRSTLFSTGQWDFTAYGSGTFTGTPTFALAVDADGDVIEVALGSGMTNPMTTTGDIIYSSDNSGTPARLGVGADGEVLTLSGGVPVWSAVVGTGTVTSVGWTGGIVSIATATTTPAFTIAGTSGGIPYFSSTSTWASSAALAANAIVIGGGAGAAPATTTTGTGVVTALGVNVGSAGAFVTFNGAGGTPSSINLTNGTLLPLTTGVTGVLDETNGGTGQSTLTQGDILFASAANTFSKLAIGTANQVLRVNAGATALEWATLAGSGTVTSITLTQPAAGITITNSGVAATTVGTFTFALAGDLAGIEALATTGIVRRTGTNTWTAGTAVSLTTEVTGTLGVGNGGTGFANGYTAGQILWASSATTLTRGFLSGTANQINVTSGAGSIVISMAFNPTVQALSDAATITWNVTNGGNAQVTLGSTGRTLSITNPIAGYTYTIEITQGSGGSKTITTWPTGTRWTGGTTPTLSTTAGQRDVVSLYYNGSNYYGTFLPNMN